MADPHTDIAQVEPAPVSGEGHAAGGHGHTYSFESVQASHNTPYPAIEPVHGWRPILMLNKAEYAKLNFHLLSQESGFASIVPSDADKLWAKDVATGTWAGQDAQLAQAMTLAGDRSLLTMPRELSFFNHQTFWSTVALFLTALILLVVARRKPDQVKPANRLQHMIEAMVLFVRDDIVRTNIHHGADAWTPVLTGLFFMILTCNLFGMIPIFGTATSSIFVTAAWALPIFFLMLVMGLSRNGPGFFIKIVPVHFSWHPMDIAVWLLLFAIELMSLVIKPCVLAIRLFANMLAGHTVLLVFASLGFIIHGQNPDNLAMSLGLGSFAWVVTVAFYFLELLVAFVQAYVFTMLSAVFIGSCIQPEH